MFTSEELCHPLVHSAHAPLSLVLVRHAEAAHTNDDPLGPPLTPLGRIQARQLARRLGHQTFTAIYVSDLHRARQTCDAIAARCNAPVTVTRDLREISDSHTPMSASYITPPPDSELEEERDAVKRFIKHVRNHHKPGELVLVVAHGNLLRALSMMLIHESMTSRFLLELFNTSVTVIDVWPKSKQVVLRLANCVRHLHPRQIT